MKTKIESIAYAAHQTLYAAAQLEARGFVPVHPRNFFGSYSWSDGAIQLRHPDGRTAEVVNCCGVEARIYAAA